MSPAEKAKYDEIFLKTDKDMDGYVSGLEVRETFLKTGLPSASVEIKVVSHHGLISNLF